MREEVDEDKNMKQGDKFHYVQKAALKKNEFRRKVSQGGHVNLEDYEKRKKR